MLMIGVDYHPSDQYVAFADRETRECGERRLDHNDGKRRFRSMNTFAFEAKTLLRQCANFLGP
jgi:hypothetical protein